jgi:uncharacterized ferritin-like protein (DUF455 family)
MTGTLAEAACAVLAAADPAQKAALSAAAARDWREGRIAAVGNTLPPARPARPARPALLAPRDMPKRKSGQSAAHRVALLHALAHIELNAIDLAWDIVARFTHEDLPKGFYDDWVTVADEEALHFRLLADRLAVLGIAYGDLPAHDGLWQAAEETAHDLLARLALVPLVLEARGLDVTPATIANLERAGDGESAAVLRRIYDDEIGHVAAGRRWFEHVSAARGLEPVATWQTLVRRHFRGSLKPPFNDDARAAAGFDAAFYRPLAG